MLEQPIWYGTQQEAQELAVALGRNCSCENAPDGTRLSTCNPHQMLVEGGQSGLDHLLYGKRIANRLEREEFIVRPYFLHSGSEFPSFEARWPGSKEEFSRFLEAFQGIWGLYEVSHPLERLVFARKIAPKLREEEGLNQDIPVS